MKNKRKDWYLSQRQNVINIGLIEIKGLMNHIDKGDSFYFSTIVGYRLKGETYENVLHRISISQDEIKFQYGFSSLNYHQIEQIENPIELITTIIEQLENSIKE
jgi:hypothetical protein